MADRDRDAVLAQPRDVVVVGEVRALHRVAERLHDLGDAAHADAADADEVDRSDVSRGSFMDRSFPMSLQALLRRRLPRFLDARRTLDQIGQPLGGIGPSLATGRARHGPRDLPLHSADG